MNLGSNLKLQRKKAGLTQSEFAQKTNTSVATLRRWESGQTSPDASKIIKIAEVLKVSPEEIFSGNSIKNSDDNFKNDASSLNPNVNIQTNENQKNMLVLENKREGIRYEIPPTVEGYKLFWELYLHMNHSQNENSNSK